MYFRSLVIVNRIYAYVDDWSGLYLFGGPAIIMDQYHNRERDVKEKIALHELLHYIDDGGPYTGFLTAGLNEIVKARTGSEIGPSTKRILDFVKGVDDLCTCAHRVYWLLT